MLRKRIRMMAMMTVLLMVLRATACSGFSGNPFTGTVVYADDAESIPVKVLMIPKFEIDDVEGDFPGEAQLFYEHYCSGCMLKR